MDHVYLLWDPPGGKNFLSVMGLPSLGRLDSGISASGMKSRPTLLRAHGGRAGHLCRLRSQPVPCINTEHQLLLLLLPRAGRQRARCPT